MILCRLSHTYKHIAYDEFYAVYVRKLPSRKVYGIKLSDKLHATRGFLPSIALANGEQQEQSLPRTDEDNRREAVKVELGVT